MKNLIDVTIVSPYEILFSGKALSVTSKNSKGDFDVLSEHAKFITIIENSPIIIKKDDNQNQTFSFPLAIIYVNNDKLKIYAQLEFPKI